MSPSYVCGTGISAPRTVLQNFYEGCRHQAELHVGISKFFLHEIPQWNAKLDEFQIVQIIVLRNAFNVFLILLHGFYRVDMRFYDAISPQATLDTSDV